MSGLCLLLLTTLLVSSHAAFLVCEIELCSGVSYSGYCQSWSITINASPRGDYRVVTDIEPILAGNINSFKYICTPSPVEQQLALWRNTFIRMFQTKNFTESNNNLMFRKFYYQTGGWPRFVYRNYHPNLTEENYPSVENYRSFAIYYNAYGSFRAKDAVIFQPVVEAESPPPYEVEVNQVNQYNQTTKGNQDNQYNQTIQSPEKNQYNQTT